MTPIHTGYMVLLTRLMNEGGEEEANSDFL